MKIKYIMYQHIIKTTESKLEHQLITCSCGETLKGFINYTAHLNSEIEKNENKPFNKKGFYIKLKNDGYINGDYIVQELEMAEKFKTKKEVLDLIKKYKNHDLELIEIE